MDVPLKQSFRPVYFQVVIHLLILHCFCVNTVISIGNHIPTAGPPTPFQRCLARTKVDISYPSNETWWYDSQTVHVPVLRHPVAVAYAASTSDVQELVKCAVSYDIPMCPRSGGHSFEAFSNEDDHLVIDVSRIAHVKINRRLVGGHLTATVGGGIRLGPLYYELGKHKLTFSAGTETSIGLAGLVAAGGCSVLTRIWGIAADNVLELEMVDYHGKVLVANKESHPDLFFALRGGGGGSYGVVVSMKLKLYENPKVSTAYSISWNQHIPASDFSQALFKWMPWHSAPPEFSLYISYGELTYMYGLYIGEDGHEGLQRILDASGFLQLGPKGSQIYKHYSSKDLLKTRAWLDNGEVHYGDERDYADYNSPTSFIFNRLDLPPYPTPVYPTWAQIQTDPRVNATHPYGAVGTTGPIRKLKPNLIDHNYDVCSSQEIVRVFDQPAYAALDEFVAYGRGRVALLIWGGIMYKTPEDFNGFPNRNQWFEAEYRYPYYQDDVQSNAGVDVQIEMLRKILTAMEPYTNHMSYQGHASLLWTTDPKIYMPRYYGGNVDRLLRAKKIYDPKDFFNNEQSTPISY